MDPERKNEGTVFLVESLRKGPKLSLCQMQTFMYRK